MTSDQLRMVEDLNHTYESVYQAVAELRTAENRCDVLQLALNAAAAENRILAAKNRELSDALYRKQ